MILEAIGMIVAAGGAIGQGVAQYQLQKEAENKNYKLFREQLATEEERYQDSRRMADKGMRMSAMDTIYQKGEAEQNRAERKEEKGYNRLQNVANKYASILNNSVALKNAKLSPLMSRG